jgi:hypothetical protein
MPTFRNASLRAPVLLAILLGICVLNAVGQYAFSRSAFDNETVNAYAPEYRDAIDYTLRAQDLADGHFDKALDDAHRSPGYPLFLTIFQAFSEPQLAARFAQLALTALLPLIFALTLRALGFGALVQIGGALLAACNPFLYYFTPILYAEATSIVAGCALLLAVARLKPEHVYRQAVLIGALLTIMTYLKPNHLIVAAPVAVYALFAMSERRRAFISVMIGTLVLGLLPWTIYASVSQDALVPLTTVQGYNLWDGSGGRAEFGDGTLIQKVVDKYGLYDPAYAASVKQMADDAPNDYQGDEILKDAAVQLWKDHPRAEIELGFAKILHSFGFSLTDASDMAVALWTLISIAAALVLWVMKRYRAWAVYLLAALATSAAQSFVFVANQRFKVVMVDPVAVLVVVLAFCVVAQALVRRTRPEWSETFAAVPAPAR